MSIYKEKGFTFVEVMITFAIIAVILAIAVPNYLRMRDESHKTTCIANLRQINSAFDQWVAENAIPVGTVPSGGDEDEIYSYLQGSKPSCPDGGTYTMHAVGDTEQITCSRTDIGHTL